MLMPKLIYASSSKNSDMFYAVRLPIPDPFFYLDMGEKKYVFLDQREYGVFREHNTNPDIELVSVNPLYQEAKECTDQTSIANRLAYRVLEKYGLKDCIIEVPTSFPLDMADYLRSKGIVLIHSQHFFPERLIKNTDEIAAIREALLRTQQAFLTVENILDNALIEADVVVYKDVPLTSEFLRKQAERILFEHDMINVEGMIISCGAHAAIPHHQGAGPIRPHQTIVCDIFPRQRASGYFADMTRTYVKGTPSDQLQAMYDAVVSAQIQAMNTVSPGTPLSTPHQKCVDLFLDRGYHVGDQGFTHSTGHGLGIDIHEAPYVSQNSKNVFEPGHVVTIEPGLYYPQLGGVRIEDVVVVTKDGFENLTRYPTRFVIP